MKILAVDDEKDTLDFLRNVLTNEGHDVATAATAGEAMVYVQLAKFDAVLLDIMMPGLDGHDFHRWLREHWDVADTPVVVISCLTDAESKMRAKLDGAVAYLEKPFVLAKLLDVLGRIDRGQFEGVPSRA